MSASAFRSDWNSSGQIPDRAVAQNVIKRFGHIDDIEGGATSRYNFNVNLTKKAGSGMLQQKAYLSNYSFDLLSNFTFYLNDPVNGDRIRQRESRNIVGYDITYSREKSLHYFDLISNYGFGIRHDRVGNTSLEHVIDRNQTLEYFSNGSIDQTNLYALAEQTVRFADRLNFTAALRVDNLRFNYDDQLLQKVNHSDGVVFSPKVSVDYNFTNLTKVFIKTGYGFHSNDARLISHGRVSKTLPNAFGIDAGVDWKPSPGIYLNATTWLLDLEQELVYVGDEGIVEPSGSTIRKGIDVSVRYQVAPRIFVDADVNGTIARFKAPEGKEKYIPLAPALTSTGGLQYTGDRLNASARFRYLGDRPANEDFSITAEGYCLLDATLTYRLKNLTFNASVENILNTEWKEAQFETESRLRHEASSVTEIHFTPGTPRMLKLGVELEFD